MWRNRRQRVAMATMPSKNKKTVTQAVLSEKLLKDLLSNLLNLKTNVDFILPLFGCFALLVFTVEYFFFLQLCFSHIHTQFSHSKTFRSYYLVGSNFYFSTLTLISIGFDRLLLFSFYFFQLKSLRSFAAGLIGIREIQLFFNFTFTLLEIRREKDT